MTNVTSKPKKLHRRSAQAQGEEAKKRHAEQQLLAKIRQQQQDVVSRDTQLSSQTALEASHMNKQVGRAMASKTVEKFLRGLNRSLRIEPEKARNPTCGWVTLIKPNGEKVKLIRCEWPLMPEWSVHEVRKVRIPNPVQGWVDRETPAFMEVYCLGAERWRGWRNILIMLVQRRLITLEAIERLVGSGNKARWAGKLGKQNVKLEY